MSYIKSYQNHMLKTKDYITPYLLDELWIFIDKSIFYRRFLFKNLLLNYSNLNLEKRENIIIDISNFLVLSPYFSLNDLYVHIEQTYKLDNFTFHREQAISMAAKYHKKKHFLLTIGEIYAFMPRELLYIKDVEEEIFNNIAFVNIEICKILEYLFLLGKNITLVSNICYTPNFVLKFLNEKNIYFFHNIIFLNDINNKISNINLKKFLYFGDFLFKNNIVNKDVICYVCKKPKEEFILSYPKISKIYNSKNLTSSISLGLYIKKWLLNGRNMSDYWEYFGYLYGGALCYGLTNFIYKEAIKDNLEQFIFVARDGYVIEKIFNYLQNQFHTNIRTEYIYASRILRLISDIEFLKNNTPWDNKISSLFSLLTDLFDDLKKYKYRFISEQKKKHLIKRYLNKIQDLSDNTKNAFKQYIESYKFDKDKLGMFDFTTYEFSSLKLLQSVLNENNFFAYYFYLVSKSQQISLSNISKISSYSDVCFKNGNIGEFLISAPEFPIKYINKDLSFVRNFNIYEKKKIEIYKKISQYELEFSRDLLSIFGNFEVNFRSDEVVKLINGFTDNLDEVDIKMFEDIYHSENSSHSKYIRLLNPSNDFELIKNTLSYKIGIRIIKSSMIEKIIILPFVLYGIFFKTVLEQNIYKRKNSNIYYTDKEKAYRYLAYQLGECFLQHPCFFVFYSIRIYINWRMVKNNEK